MQLLIRLLDLLFAPDRRAAVIFGGGLNQDSWVDITKMQGEHVPHRNTYRAPHSRR